MEIDFTSIFVSGKERDLSVHGTAALQHSFDIFLLLNDGHTTQILDTRIGQQQFF